MSAEQLALEQAALPTLSAALSARATALAAPVATGEKPKAKRKATKAAEVALLTPVDAPTVVAAAAPATAAVPPTVFDPTDPLKSHPSRLQKIDATKCMARKAVLGKHVPGTHKDEGGVKKIHPEAQCSSAPATGQALCAKCAEQEALAIAGKRDPKKWFGRLDQPMYDFAAVVGCKQYLELYPQGIKGDPLSIPPASTERNAAPAPTAKKAPGAPKKAKNAKASEEHVAAIAMADFAPIEAEWVTFIHKGGVPAIRNLKDNMVYSVNPTETDRAKMAKMDDCLGKWDAATGMVDPYGVPEDGDDA